jgi:hypothetical protein
MAQEAPASPQPIDSLTMMFPLRLDRLQDGISRRLDQPLPGGSGTACLVGQVVTASAVIAVGKFLMVHPVSLLGAEGEGSVGAINVDSSSLIPVYLVGPTLAKQGDLLIFRFIDHRWVADRGGHVNVGQFLPGCPCPAIPDRLYLHTPVSPPTYTQSGGVWIYPFTGGLETLFPATLDYGPRPGDLAFTIPIGPDPGWWSNKIQVRSSFGDPTHVLKFRYFADCKNLGGSYYGYVLGAITTSDSFNLFHLTYVPPEPANAADWQPMSDYSGFRGCTPFWFGGLTDYPGTTKRSSGSVIVDTIGPP